MAVKINRQSNPDYDKEYQRLQKEKISTKVSNSYKKAKHRILVPCYNDMDHLDIEFIGV